MVEVWQILPRTPGFMIVIQDQVLSNNNYENYILKNLNITNICRKFGEELEAIKRITGTCRALTIGDYTHCHNQVAGVVHQEEKPTTCVTEIISYTVPC